VATARLDQAEKHLDGRALSGPVGTEETKDFAAAHGQREIADRHLTPERFAEVLRFYGKVMRLVQKRCLVLAHRVC